MPIFVIKRTCLVLLSAGGLGLASPLHAQSFEELDRLSDVSVDEASGIAAAQDQAGRGLLLEALATLERVMAVHPTSLNARMLHAYYLCAIDDQQGARVEIDNMDEDDFGRENLAELRARCATASSEFRVLSAQDGNREPVDSSKKELGNV
ncbi:hypothetical protein [Aurantiacibacter sp. D1-12]|uniref:hypothetical protein n=1 Tax=Aurantiacibacter sp. D1-12 TaxID=2993658 RepID=UPI00237CF1B5|nr:hypothetical protein [Aurantiacibacter sp. D1-12]MDE1468463.1 hypothetical protein [Aurantiacibacter sp. D1-12]